MQKQGNDEENIIELLWRLLTVKRSIRFASCVFDHREFAAEGFAVDQLARDIHHG
jgi:hypothetical protein